MKTLVRLTLALGVLVLLTAPAAGQELTQKQLEEDFDLLLSEIQGGYAYLNGFRTDVDCIRKQLRPRLAAIRTKREFLTLLETVLENLRDPHAHLNSNTSTSPNLIPSGTDLWGEWVGGRALITQVRRGSLAEQAGIRAGTEVLTIGKVPTSEAIDNRLGPCGQRDDPVARNWAFRALLAGNRTETRRLGFGGSVLELPPAMMTSTDELLFYEERPSGVAYIEINNTLGNSKLILAFDEALRRMKKARAVILDLRNTPGGGNTTVARGIIGHFVSRETPYQKHELLPESYGVWRRWLELVSPRPPRFEGPVVVLVDHWTGSMGEGIAIGLHAAAGARVVGTRMAGLLGATYSATLPHSGFGVNLPAERLYHVNGTAREDFTPDVVVDVRNASGAADPILEMGIGEVEKMLKRRASKK